MATVDSPQAPLTYRIGNTDRVIGAATGASDGFAVLNLQNGNIFTAQGGVWTNNPPAFSFPNLLAMWFGTDTANMNGDEIAQLGYRIGNSDRIIGSPTGAEDGFVVLNRSTGTAFKAQGGVWVAGGTFPADLMAAWLAT